MPRFMKLLSLRSGLLFWAVLFVISGQSAQAQIVVHTSSSMAGDSASFSWSHTVGVAENRLIVVALTHDNCATSVSSVTYAGTHLTEIASACSNGTDAKRTHMFALVAPSSGTGVIVVTLSAKSKTAMGATDFSGIDQLNPYGSPASATGNSVNAQVSIASASGQIVVDAIGTKSDASVVTASGGQTQDWTANSTGGSGGSIAGSSHKTGASTITMSWTLSAAKEWAIIAIGLNPVQAANLSVTKTSQVLSDPVNTTVSPKAIPGSTLRYVVTIENAGPSGASNAVVVDQLPSGISYLPGSLTLDSTTLTDAADLDAGQWNPSTRTITVAVGNLSANSKVTITWTVTVN